MKPQCNDAVGGQSKRHPSHSPPKPSSVQSAEGCAHQESASPVTNQYARTDHHPSQILVCEEFAITTDCFKRKSAQGSSEQLYVQ